MILKSSGIWVNGRFALQYGWSSCVSFWIRNQALAASLPINDCDRERRLVPISQEAQAEQSRADFMSKKAIALKEARACHYWLKLLEATGILSEDKLKPLDTEAEALIRIISH